MDRIASLNAFVKVAELGSFSEAGRQLRLSRSAVSKYVADLEHDLGVQLLTRTTRHASLTEIGKTYFERVAAILSDLAEADRTVAHQQASPRGLLRVNAPMSFGTLKLGKVIGAFMTLYPELQIQLILGDNQVDPVQEAMDVTLRIAELQSSSLIARRIMPIDRVVCASPAYLQRAGTPLHPNDLRNHTCLSYGFLATGNQWKLTGADGDHWIAPPWTLCVNNAEVLRDVALNGLGIAVIPRFIAEAALTSGELVPVLDAWKPPPLALYAIYPSTRHLVPKVRIFIDFLAATFR